jgi:hypothetical protein
MYLIVSVLIATLAHSAYAAESSAGAPMPELKSDEGSNVVAETCSVTLSGDEATVELSVSTAASQPALLIEGTSFGWLGETEVYPDRHFPELQVRIDGRLVTPQERFEAFMGKNDISYAIREAGMDPWAIARSPPVTPVNPGARQIHILERMHAVEHAGENYLAHWTARRLLRIPLKTAARETVTLSYLARPAFSQLQSDQLLTGAQQAAYCTSLKQVSAMLHTSSKPRPLKITEYSIATGIDGHPAHTVTLRTSIEVGAAATARAFIFVCGPHGKSIAGSGNLTDRPVQADQQGTLHVIKVSEP